MADVNGSHRSTMEDITNTLEGLGVADVTRFPDTYPEFNPVDIYRAHITDILAPLAGVEPKIVLQALAWTQTLDKGDLVLPVPALRIKGKKPNEITAELAEKVDFRGLMVLKEHG